MTVGQCIAQKRKEMGYSQEALGDQLGVSRQAIYKWESDAALPEIEKLVALSKLFDVSVGWLLGVEEDTPKERPDQETLNQAQLDMVEEIVRRYIEAQPKPKPRRKWPWVLAACVLVWTLVQMVVNIDQLTNQYMNLQNSVNNINYSVNSQINSITDRVEQILMSQNNLTAEYSSQILSLDYYNNEVTIAMKAVPRTYIQGMGAVFLADCGNGPQEFESILMEGHTFTCEATVPLTDSITVSVVFISKDGTRQTQVLDTYTGYLGDSYADLSIHEYDLMYKEFEDGRFVLDNWYVPVWDSYPGKGDAKIEAYKLGVFRNQKLIGWAEPCEKPNTYHGDYTDAQFFKMPSLELENLTEGETLAVAALVTDSYGRQYMYFDVPYLVAGKDEQTCYLTWPDSVMYERDIADWTFE